MAKKWQKKWEKSGKKMAKNGQKTVLKCHDLQNIWQKWINNSQKLAKVPNKHENGKSQKIIKKMMAAKYHF